MTNWIITVYHGDSDGYLEFDMESDTKPTDKEILEQLEFFVEIDNPVLS